MTAIDLAPPRVLALLPLGAGVALAAAGLSTDAGGRLLLWPACAVLLVVGLRDLLLRPALSLREEGLVVVVGWQRRTIPWSQLDRARVVSDRRTPLLELDVGDTMVVLSRRRLGCPPYRALELVEQQRPRR